MQPTNPISAQRGSFARPDVPKPQPVPESVPVEAAPEVVADNSEKPVVKADDMKTKIKAWMKELSEVLNAEVTDKDLREYILKGRVSKEVSIGAGFKGTFQTLRIDELQEIDEKMAAARDKSNLTAKGIENEEAIHALAYSWTHVDGRPLGQTPDDRALKIRKMGSIFVEKASTARVNLDSLIRFSLQEHDVIKKS